MVLPPDCLRDRGEPQRRDRQALAPQSHARRRGTTPAPKACREGTAPEDGAEGAVSDAQSIVRRAAARRRADPQRTLLLVARVERGAMPLADLYPGARGFLFLRQRSASRPALLRRPHKARLPARLSSAGRRQVRAGGELINQ